MTNWHGSQQTYAYPVFGDCESTGSRNSDEQDLRFEPDNGLECAVTDLLGNHNGLPGRYNDDRLFRR